MVELFINDKHKQDDSCDVNVRNEILIQLGDWDAPKTGFIPAVPRVETLYG